MIFIKGLTKKPFSVITPYIIPKELNKKVNAGDGFIFDSSLKLIGFNPEIIFSSRERLNDEKISLINSTKILIIAGANIIKDKFEIISEFNIRTLEKIKIPIILMGIGHYGVKATNQFGLDSNSKIIVNELLDRFPLISVRCNGSYDYMKKFLPEKTDNILNTSCPVIFNLENFNKNFKKKLCYDQLVVTVTDREMLKEQLPIIRFAPSFFRSKKKVLALHQDYGNTNLQNFATKLGYEVFISKNYLDYIELYKNSDLHFGNRVHAHLKCLSLGIPSFCTPFDLRQYYFSKSIGLPLVNNEKEETLKTFEFKNFTIHQKEAKKVMDRFTNKILTYIDS